MADALQQNSNLDPGESHAIVLALEKQADELLIDERRGRQEAMKLGIPIIGILVCCSLLNSVVWFPKFNRL
jgi:uncharacterized protein